MAFLDNSGDIILDAVLTDTGRARLAKGDGSFRIVKFALADDEIDYSQYQNANYEVNGVLVGANPSGSAYYDLDILMTPILEAFTNNSSSMKSKILSIPRNNLLYLPILKLNELPAKTKTADNGGFYVTVDSDTESAEPFTGTGPNAEDGVIFGGTQTNNNSTFIKIDQGLDTDEISSDFQIDNDLLETQYIVEIDNRLGTIVSAEQSTSASVSYIDDDNIASYYLSNTDATFVKNIPASSENNNPSLEALQVIEGPRGTTLEFGIRASLELNSSTYLFERLGGTDEITVPGTPSDTTYTFYFIDSIVRVMGATTGYKIDIPVRFVKIID